MSHIRILQETLHNKIAAGEVVERPSSIVKELVENAIDAGSTDVRIEVVRGGKRRITVSDNGMGMDREDAHICFQRHATSKLSTEADLFHITTMGFRGEALASIASVSRMRISTAHRGSSAGTDIEVLGGEILSDREVSTIGTRVEVKDLFYNTPVRKKFLKTDHTELYHIIDFITRASLINAGIAFKLIADSKETLNLSAALNMKERLIQIYGADFLKGMTEVHFHEQAAGITLEGFISKRENTRSSRGNQYLFVNKRPVIDVSLRHALYRAYSDFLDEDDHPMFFLHLKLSPSEVDVNVHPTKREVRFAEKEQVYNLVYRAVREAIEKSKDVLAGGESQERALKGPAAAPSSEMMAPQHREYVQGEIVSGVSESRDVFYHIDGPFIYIGDVFAAYSESDGLCIIDHHAAHERVVYEKLKKGTGYQTQRLLFPKQVRLGIKEYNVLLKQSDVLAKMGFEVEDFGMNTLIVRTIPEFVDDSFLNGLLSDAAASIMDIKESSPLEIMRNELAKRIACHSSVRGAVILKREEIVSLIKDLDATDDPHHCPHGRPTRISISLDELRRRFERK